jgi:VWFA-related protein
MAARKHLLSSGLAWISLLLAPTLVHTQTAPPAAATPTQQTTPVFHASTRLVLVDVVITDHKGQFVPGLKAADFTILEDGKPQKISAFSAHITPPAPKNGTPPLKLPPHQFSNFTYVPQQADRPVTIVLMDMLNTAGQTQQYARKQMIAFLKALPEGRPVALFALTSGKLSMIQGFTGDSTVLVKAATALMAHESLLMTSEAQTQQEEIGATSLESIGAPASVGPAGGTGTGATMPIAPVGQAIRNALASEDTFQELERMGLTISALDVLARAVAGYPGRKNLIWLSSQFPIMFGPNMNPYNQATQTLNATGGTLNHQLHNLEYDTPPLAQTSALLAAAQVAVYPIDVGGLAPANTGLDVSTSTANLSNLSLHDETAGANSRQTALNWDTHESMKDVARETGGEAFYGTNDLKGAMSRGMEEGSNYYTIAYSPANHDWNSKYRKIEVKTADSGAKLAYRRGYYALPVHPFTGDRAAASLAIAMKFSVPEFTMLFLKVQVLPPDAEHKTVRIDYAVDGHDISFSDGDDQMKHASVDFMATAWDKDLKLVAHKADTMDATLRPDAYQQIMHTGLPFHQELDLKPGTYTLRFGALDRGSQKIGTVDVPITIADPTQPEAAKSSK